jgi:Enoyl-CoA hydratase/isomerase
MASDAQRGSEILYHRAERDGAIWAEIELNRPEKANALTMPMVAALADAIGAIESDREVRAVVLRGRGRFFCAGGDIAAWGSLSPQDMADRWILPGIRVLNRLASLPVPVIAVLSGHALGGGLELALAADLRLARKSVKLGTPEVALGMIAGWGGVRRLAETIGVARARHMSLLGQSITAEQALDWTRWISRSNSPPGWKRCAPTDRVRWPSPRGFWRRCTMTTGINMPVPPRKPSARRNARREFARFSRSAGRCFAASDDQAACVELNSSVPPTRPNWSATGKPSRSAATAPA